jgi:hypothetical protein
MRMVRNFRALFGVLADALVEEGDTVRAKAAMDYCLKVIPSYNIAYDFYSTNDLASTYDRIGDKEHALLLYSELTKNSFKNLDWYSRLSKNQYRGVLNEVKRELFYLQFSLPFFEKEDPELYQQYINEYGRHHNQFNQFLDSQRSSSKGGRNR